MNKNVYEAGKTDMHLLVFGGKGDAGETMGKGIKQVFILFIPLFFRLAKVSRAKHVSRYLLSPLGQKM